MAFFKYASATVTQPFVSPSTWGKIRTASGNKTVSANIVDQATDIFGDAFDPEKYLLTHATIVASVDTYEPKNMKMGSVTEDGFQVNRKYSNFRIKPSCDKFINNNLNLHVPLTTNKHLVCFFRTLNHEGWVFFC